MARISSAVAGVSVGSFGDFAQFGLVDVEIAADDDEDEFAAAALVEDGLGGSSGRNAEQVREGLDRRRLGGGDLLDREQLLGSRDIPAKLGDFAVGGVVAVRADEDGVFAVRERTP